MISLGALAVIGVTILICFIGYTSQYIFYIYFEELSMKSIPFFVVFNISLFMILLNYGLGVFTEPGSPNDYVFIYSLKFRIRIIALYWRSRNLLSSQDIVELARYLSHREAIIVAHVRNVYWKWTIIVPGWIIVSVITISVILSDSWFMLISLLLCVLLFCV